MNFFVRLWPLRIVSPRFERAELLRLCNNLHEGEGEFLRVVKTWSPGTPVTQYMRWHNSPRGVKPLVRVGLIVSPIVSQSPICVTAFRWHNSLWTDSTVTGVRVRIVSPIVSPGLVTQLRGGLNCVTNCVTGSGDTIQGLLRKLSGSLRSEKCHRFWWHKSLC